MAADATMLQANQVMLIAPCGMNCGLCRAFLRSRNRCPGCRGDDRGKPKTRVGCRIKTCRKRVGGDFCFECSSFPCEPLCALDKRYRTKYGMSMIDNLKSMAVDGVARFIEREKLRWACPGCGATLCVHEASCLVCKRKRDDAA